MKKKKFPRYLQEQKYGNGMVFYRYNPSSRYIDEGIVTRTNLGSDLSIAKKKANENKSLAERDDMLSPYFWMMEKYCGVKPGKWVEARQELGK